jgi:hypothetical protein
MARAPRFSELEPQKCVRAKCDRVRVILDRREPRTAEHFQRHRPAELAKLEPRVLHEPGEVGDHEDLLLTPATNERKDACIRALDHDQVTASKCLVSLAQSNDPFHPPQQ